MKHAYLILAHNEFPILERLLQAIDDPKNDIFIHYDKKLKEYPRFQTGNAGLFILDNLLSIFSVSEAVITREIIVFTCSPVINSRTSSLL